MLNTGWIGSQSSGESDLQLDVQKLPTSKTISICQKIYPFPFSESNGALLRENIQTQVST